MSLAPTTQEITLPETTIAAKRIEPYTTAGGRNWLRDYKLILTDERAGDKAANNEVNNLDLSQLRITFDIQSSINQSLKHMTARVYNVGPDTVRDVLKQFTSVRLEAGYTGTAGEVFSGVVSYFESGRESPTDTVLTIQATDSDFQANGTPINLTLEKGHTASDVVTACIQTMGLKPGVISELDPSKSPRGRACVGMPRDILRDIAQANNATVSVEGGRVNILKYGATFEEVSIVLNSQSGMIGTPKLTMDGAMSVTALLNSRFKPGAGITLDEKDIYKITQAARFDGLRVAQGTVADDQKLNLYVKNAIRADGFYKIASVHHQGDTRGNAWFSHLVTMPANPTSAPVKFGVQ